MPAEFVRCVRHLIADGKERDSAYAICTAQYKKKHGVTPQQAAGEADLWELIDKMDGEGESKHGEAQTDIEGAQERTWHTVEVTEVEFDDSTGMIELDIIRSGVTKNGRREYTEEALRKAAPLYSGIPMHLDHSTETEDAERPAGSVRNLAAVINTAWFENGAVRARAKVVDPPWSAKLKECWPYIGISADQIVRGRKAEAERKERLIVEAIESVRRVDFVTRANAGGAVTRILEHYETDERTEDEVNMKELTIEALREARPDLIEALTKATEPETESDDVALTEDKVKEMIAEAITAAKGSANESEIKQVAREVQILRCAPKIFRIVKEANLHPEVEQRVRERLSDYADDDEEKRKAHVEEIIRTEREYAARLTGEVHGMGGEPADADDDEETAEDRTAREERIKKGRERFAQG